MSDIDKELKEIENAPKVPIVHLQPTGHGLSGRCHWCGRWRTDLDIVEVVNGLERLKGGCCRPPINEE